MIKITYFVHGTTTDNEEGVSSGWKDVGLSDLGVKQSRDLAQLIDPQIFDVIFCSDLKRAIDSTRLTFGDDDRIKIDPRLRECNYGDYNGEASAVVDPMQPDFIDVAMPGGESYKDVEARTKEFLADIQKLYDGKHIAIVAHKAPHLALEVILNKQTWRQAMENDWRKTKSWQPGWEYGLS